MSAENIRILNTTKELPNNIEAEQIILGSILVNNEIFDEISTIVNENIFFDPVHQKIFHYLNKLISKGLLASPITLKNYLENEQSLKELGGNEYIAKLTRLSTSAFQAKDYAKVIYDLHLRRKLIELSENTLTEANNKNLENTAEQLIEGTEKKLFDLAERGKFDRSYMSFEKALGETVDMAMRAFKNDEGIVGVPTGLRDLDERLGGMHKGDLIIIAGRPSMGKTALATNIAFHAAKKIMENKQGKSSVAFLRVTPLGVTAEIGSIARTSAGYFNILPARLEGLDTLRGCLTIVKETFWSNNGLFIFGLVLGSFALATFSGDFKIQIPKIKESIRSFVGGILMGFGSMIALGCTVGTLLSGIMAASLSGWIFLIFCGTGLYLGWLLRKKYKFN